MHLQSKEAIPSRLLGVLVDKLNRLPIVNTMYYVVAASNDVVFIPLARTVVARFLQRLAIDDLTDSLLFVPGMIDNELSDLDTLSFSLLAMTEAVQILTAENRDETLSFIRSGIGLDE
jgi:hypothetical protein